MYVHRSLSLRLLSLYGPIGFYRISLYAIDI